MARRRKPSLGKRIQASTWDRLSSDQRACVWSVSLHTSILIGLGLITFGSEHVVYVTLNAGLVDTQPQPEILTLEPLEEIELEEVLEPEPEPLEILNLPETQFDVDDLIPPASELPSEEHVEIVNDSPIGGEETENSIVTQIHRRVEAAGGSVEGEVVVSLQFLGSTNDIDLHVIYMDDTRNPRRTRRHIRPPTTPPNPIFGIRFGDQIRPRTSFPPGQHIYFRHPRTEHAALDVDSNARTISPEPIENVVFYSVPKRARYTVVVDTYRMRQPLRPTPFSVVVKRGTNTQIYNGTLQPFERRRKVCSFLHIQRRNTQSRVVTARR